MSKRSSCLVVGAGMSGLVAANILQDAGWQVIVMDKGRGVGGRMATRRIGGATFDHGAQYFTVRDAEFARYVNRWLRTGVVEEWAKGFPTHENHNAEGKHCRYRGADGMTDIAKMLTTQLDVRTNTLVRGVEAANDGWQVRARHLDTDEEATYIGDALVMTPPAEQTLKLLENVALPEPVFDALDAIEFAPCFAVMAHLDQPSQIPAPGGIFMPGEPIRWMADNQQKGISDEPAVTIHAGAEFTRKHYDDDLDDVAQTLIGAARDYLGDARVIDYQVQRWRYSQPTSMHPELTLFTDDPAPVAFAGDAFSGAKIEGAALSGMAAAQKLIQSTQ